MRLIRVCFRGLYVEDLPSLWLKTHGTGCGAGIDLLLAWTPEDAVGGPAVTMGCVVLSSNFTANSA